MTTLNGPTSFANDGKDVLETTIELNDELISQLYPLKEDLELLSTTFDIENTSNIIIKEKYKRVSLQFPDELLFLSSSIVELLKKKINENVEENDIHLYVLADTSYGSCCVDEVAAEHVNSDLIIHYGHSCLSRTTRVPVKYVFGNFPIDTDHCCESFNEKFNYDKDKPIIILFDVIYHYKIREILIKLKEEYGYTNILTPNLDYKNDDLSIENLNIMKLDTIDLPDGKKIQDFCLFYIGGTSSKSLYSNNGEENAALTNFLITYSQCPSIITYEPCTMRCRDDTYRAGGALMKRYVMVQKVKDSNIIGIVVGTLGVELYQTMIEQIKLLIKACGKKYYLFVMGKINVAKMANFMEIDSFVYIACPENTLMDSREFFKPIVTPYELMMGLCEEELPWTGEYITKFSLILPRLCDLVEKEKLKQRERLNKLSQKAKAEKNNEEIDYEDEAPHFSMLTGTLKSSRPYDYNAVDTHINNNQNDDEISSQIKELTLLNTTKEIANYMGSAAGEFLSQRSFQGLEQRIGETEVKDIQIGKKGNARGYAHEKEEI
ncbi:diphthamide biosynthesis protein [Anaeromyces robustus]|uniref:2-(3-amino-3-carboxypropyl)histidine synthase subunit 2 n=1 Tax=Anaeromyces robustus TaxID=1754192 RepID=A0A1Y1XBS2_9FUNG|nr:diphthamide biosynthesis protein [Anaeromyces robustus]|eukprot:ORX82814.1 diphthamide biosynthesis protein [Anaeromyces robustus]